MGKGRRERARRAAAPNSDPSSSSSSRPPPPPPPAPSSSRPPPPPAPNLDPSSAPFSSRPPPRPAPNSDPSSTSSSSIPPTLLLRRRPTRTPLPPPRHPDPLHLLLLLLLLLRRPPTLTPLPPPLYPYPPAPPPPRAPNYASNWTDKQKRFDNFVNDYVEEVGEPPYFIEALHSMRNRSSYTLNISYEQMWQFGDFELLISTCNDRKYRENEWLLPAARKFLKGGFGDDEMIYKKTRLSYSGFPVSMQKLEDSLPMSPLVKPVLPLVKPVEVFGGKLSVLAPTSHGRLLIAMLMVALLENHSKGISWNGAFGIADIVIIDYGNDCKQMKVLTKPVKRMERMWEAKVKDLQRVAELIIPYYKADNGTLPVYFSQLKEELDGVTNALVEEAWFREYLSYHVAFMPSSARRCLETMLYATFTNCKGYNPFLEKYPTAGDWRTELQKQDNKCVLHKVYSHRSSTHQVVTDPYENSMRGIMRFKRNVLEHGGQGQVCVHIAELELCAAKMLSEFLPRLLRMLLEQEKMERVFGEAWENFKASRSAKRDFWSD